MAEKTDTQTPQREAVDPAPAGSGFWWVDLGLELRYIKRPGISPVYEKTLRRFPGGGSAGQHLPDGFTASDLRAIADHMDSQNVSDQ